MDEKEYICDFLKINPYLDFEVSVNILNNIKLLNEEFNNKYKKQFK